MPENAHKSLKELIRGFFDLQITGSAAELSYYFLFSVFPLITITGMISYSGDGTQSAFVNFVSRFTPDIVLDLFDGYFRYSSAENKTALFSVGMLVSLYAVARYIKRLKKKIREVYNECSHVGFLKEWLLSFVYSVLLVFAFYFTLILQSVCERIIEISQNAFTASVYNAIDYVFSLRYVAVAIYIFLLLITAYMYIPIDNIKFSDALPGAVISTTAWIAVCSVFTKYIDDFSHYSYSYGQLSAFLVLMIWIFILNCIILMGALINKIFCKST